MSASNSRHRPRSDCRLTAFRVGSDLRPFVPLSRETVRLRGIFGPRVKVPLSDPRQTEPDGQLPRILPPLP
jgi:hypothetical protein